jgi:hypothetical protein
MLLGMINTMYQFANICENTVSFVGNVFSNSSNRQQDDSSSGGGFQKPCFQMTQAKRDEHLRRNVPPLSNPFRRPPTTHQRSSGSTHGGSGERY